MSNADVQYTDTALLHALLVIAASHFSLRTGLLHPSQLSVSWHLLLA